MINSDKDIGGKDDVIKEIEAERENLRARINPDDPLGAQYYNGYIGGINYVLSKLR